MGNQNTTPGAPPPPPAPPTFGQTLDKSFGTGNPYAPDTGLYQTGTSQLGTGAGAAGAAGGALSGLAGMSTGNQWYGNSPIQTAEAVANRNLQKNLGALNARYGATGGGNSARAGIAAGTATGEAATGLGDVLAARGIQARQGDIQNAITAQSGAGNLGLGVGNLGLGAMGQYGNQVGTALQAQLGAGAQSLQGQQLDLDRAKALGDQGQNITGIGAGEQNIPNAGALAAFISALTGGTQAGTASGSSKTRPF